MDCQSIVCGSFVLGPCFVMHSSFAIISLGKRELFILLLLSSWCVLALLMVSWVGLQSVIVAFQGHTYLYLSNYF